MHPTLATLATLATLPTPNVGCPALTTLRMFFFLYISFGIGLLVVCSGNRTWQGPRHQPQPLFFCLTLELEFVDGGNIGFNLQHQNAYDSIIQIHTVDTRRCNQVTILCLDGMCFEATLYLLTFKTLRACEKFAEHMSND